MILAERAARIAAEAQAAEASAVRQGLALEIERLKLEIARLRRERFGPSAERSARLEQLELSLEDLEEAAAEADAAQAADAGETTEVGGFTRRKPARRPPPEHLPRTPVIHPAPGTCPQATKHFSGSVKTSAPAVLTKNNTRVSSDSIVGQPRSFD